MQVLNRKKNRMLKFSKKNFIYDNGIINFLLLLEKKYEREFKVDVFNEKEHAYYFSLEKKFTFKLSDYYFEVLKGGEEEFKELCFNVFSSSNSFIKISEKRFQYYREEKEEKFVLRNSMYADGFSGGDVINASQLWKPIKYIQLEGKVINKDTIQNIVERQKLEEGFEDLLLNKMVKKRKIYIDENNKIAKNDEGELCIKIYGEKSKFDNAFSKYVLGDNFDSRVMPFESGGSPFEDFIKNSKSVSLCDNIFYQFGYRVKKYYNRKKYYYLHSDSLIDLFDIKDFLRIEETKVEKQDEKKGTVVLSTNMNLDVDLKEKSFFAQSENDYQLKMLLWIYGKCGKLKKAYINFLSKNPSIYGFENEQMKSSLHYYQKINRLFELFKKLENSYYTKIRDGTEERKSLLSILFGRGGILMKIYNVKVDGKTPLLLSQTTYNILNFIPLRKIYMIAQENLLKKKETLPLGLKEFEDVYLKELGKHKDLLLHDISYNIGSDMGRFLGIIGDKDLIFKLRNIKNCSQLIGYISNLFFLTLKNSEKGGLKKETKEQVKTLLEILHKDNREIVKNYLGIYIIQKYQNMLYAQSQSNK